jgi:hypothetical protein
MNEMHKGVFMGKVLCNRYYFKVDYDLKHTSNFDYIKTNHRGVINSYCEEKFEKINECNFERPPLEAGDLIHIHKLDVVVKVLNTIRSTDGSIIYRVDYVIKKIDDEESERSKKVAEEELEKWELEQHTKELKEETVKLVPMDGKKKWYQFWK